MSKNEKLEAINEIDNKYIAISDAGDIEIIMACSLDDAKHHIINYFNCSKAWNFSSVKFAFNKLGV